MARFELRVTDNFVEEVACIEEERVIARVQMLAESLCGNPFMGRALDDAKLVELMGDNLYAYPVGAYQILYRFDGAVVEVLGITLLPPAERER